MDLERLVDQNKDAVYRQMVRVCGNYDDAEDALADALYAAIKSAEQLRDPSLFRAWLTKIGSRACMRRRIRERLLKMTSLAELQKAGFDPKDDWAHPDLDAETKVVRNCVAGAVDSLTDIYREVYVRREIKDESAEEVAAALGISIPAVKSRLHRARETMRHALDTGFGCEGLIS